MTVVDTLLVGYHFTTHRKGFVCNFSLWGDYPLCIPHITPFSQSWSESAKLLKVALWNRSLSPHDNISMDTELVMKGGMNWCCALLWVSLQGHLKVISMSLECQNDETCFFAFLSIPNPFGVKVSFTSD